MASLSLSLGFHSDGRSRERERGFLPPFPIRGLSREEGGGGGGAISLSSLSLACLWPQPRSRDNVCCCSFPSLPPFPVYTPIRFHVNPTPTPSSSSSWKEIRRWYLVLIVPLPSTLPLRRDKERACSFVVSLSLLHSRKTNREFGAFFTDVVLLGGLE